MYIRTNHGLMYLDNIRVLFRGRGGGGGGSFPPKPSNFLADVSFGTTVQQDLGLYGKNHILG